MKLYVINSNCKLYVGVSNDVEKRMKNHIKADSYVGRSMRKHGFTYEILFDGSVGECFAEEIRLIKEMNTKWPSGFNLTDGGEGVVGETDEVRQSRSQAMKRVMADPKRREQSAANGRNQIWDQERRALQAERARKQMTDPARREVNRKTMSERAKVMWSDSEYRKLKSDQARAFWAARKGVDV